MIEPPLVPLQAQPHHFATPHVHPYDVHADPSARLDLPGETGTEFDGCVY